MYLTEFLARFSGVEKHGDHYAAKCPCHDDKRASLSIDVKAGNDGRQRIFLHDHAGCSTDAILAAVGCSYADLVLEPDPDWERRNSGKACGNGGKRQKAAGKREGGKDGSGTDGADPDGADGAGGRRGGGGGGQRGDGDQRPGAGAAGAEENPEKVDTESVPGMVAHTVGGKRNGGEGNDGAVNSGPEIDWKNPDRVYSYTDGDGREIFQVVRYHYLNGVKGKTFRQRMRPTAAMMDEAKRAGKPLKVTAAGWMNSVPESVRDGVLYRMPNIRKAIAEGRPVYVVEGEKDVETLERLGYCATCNAGGAGKWLDSYSWILAGADLIILPDNDPRNDKGGYPGQDHAYNVAMKSYKVAKRVRIVNLKEACPELPAKGDISDMIAIMGDAAGMDALARQVAATRDFDPEMVPFWLTPMEQAEKLYGMVTGYGAEKGCIVQRTGDTTKPLCDFVVIPRMEKILDDGVSRNRVFVLDGWNASGAKLERVNISGADLDGMNWVTREWGYKAGIVPGSTTKAKVAWCIKKVGQMMSKEVVEYTHTGWRRIGGKWCYLYQGGAIGAEGVTVNMEEGPNRYRLDGCGNPDFRTMDPREAARKSLGLMQVMKKIQAITLLGTVYLAPLREWMLQTDIQPAYSLFFHGSTQIGKSTAVGLAMAHYGNFHSKNAPVNFGSTSNSIRAMAFQLKDAPIWVDDFHPTNSQQEKRKMDAIAQSLARAFGDGATRGRLNSDGTIQAARPPRSIAIMTGEDLPNVGASGLARFFIVDVDSGDIQRSKEMTEMQEAAREGWLQKAMRGYIEFLAKHAGQLPEYLHEEFIKTREMVQRIGAGEQARAPEAIACILIGFNMMTSYMANIGAISIEERVKLGQEALRELTEASRKQSREMENEKPTRIFLDTLSELMASRKAWVKDLVIVSDKVKNEPLPMDNMIGYRDNEFYYLLPEMAYTAVSVVCRQAGREFPVSRPALYKHLVADGVVTGLKPGESAARVKNVGGVSKRVLQIPASMIDGVGGTEQVRMDFGGSGKAESGGGFTAVADPGLPEEWT